jgi:hypothetical protein
MHSLIRRAVTTTALISIVVIGTGLAAPALAAPPEYPHGVGVCVSQVAIMPELVGVDRWGDAVRDVAGTASPGSEMPVLLDDLRGDGPGGCGAPPGPGHLP